MSRIRLYCYATVIELDIDKKQGVAKTWELFPRTYTFTQSSCYKDGESKPFKDRFPLNAKIFIVVDTGSNSPERVRMVVPHSAINEVQGKVLHIQARGIREYAIVGIGWQNAEQRKAIPIPPMSRDNDDVYRNLWSDNLDGTSFFVFSYTQGGETREWVTVAPVFPQPVHSNSKVDSCTNGDVQSVKHQVGHEVLHEAQTQPTHKQSRGTQTASMPMEPRENQTMQENAHMIELKVAATKNLQLFSLLRQHTSREFMFKLLNTSLPDRKS